MNTIPAKIADSFETVPESGCWIWTGALDKGYGAINWNGSRRCAHRVLYEILRGPIPNGYECHHLCGNRSCINPNHIELVTRSEHMQLDGRGLKLIKNAAAKNHAKTHCKRGHKYTDKTMFIPLGGWRTCRVCMNQATKEKRRTDPTYRERINTQERLRRIRDKEKINRQKRERWHKRSLDPEFRERTNKAKRAWREKNKEEINRKRREQYAK